MILPQNVQNAQLRADRLIDQVVSRLHGLTEKESAVLEGSG